MLFFASNVILAKSVCFAIITSLLIGQPFSKLNLILFRRSAMVAQLTVNQLVVGSNPTAGAKYKKASISGAFLNFVSDVVGFEQERGRENESFTVVEILKPQGFKERSE